MNILSETRYLNLLRSIKALGTETVDRTGVGTRRVFAPAPIKYILSYNSMPVLTTKKIQFDSVVDELLWFIKGSTNVTDLKTSIWDDWADKDGDLGPTYGKMWRNLPRLSKDDVCIGYVDQLLELEYNIKNNPTSRRLVLSNYNPSYASQCALPPCHVFAQFFVENGHLDCQLYQRSADMFLGVPFNVASYSLLTAMLAKTCGLKARYFTHVLGDAHIYLNHLNQVSKQLNRKPRLSPEISLASKSSIVEFTAEDISLINYNPYPAIKAPIAV